MSHVKCHSSWGPQAFTLSSIQCATKDAVVAGVKREACSEGQLRTASGNEDYGEVTPWRLTMQATCEDDGLGTSAEDGGTGTDHAREG
jgi:hypothetical protein